MISANSQRSPRTEGGGVFAPVLGDGSGAKRAFSPRDLFSTGAIQ